MFEKYWKNLIINLENINKISLKSSKVFNKTKIIFHVLEKLRKLHISKLYIFVSLVNLQVKLSLFYLLYFVNKLTNLINTYSRQLTLTVD